MAYFSYGGDKMRFSIDTLGCKVNTYESNVIIDLFESHGYEQVKENADVAIINTCTVTNTADRKSVKMIHQAVHRNPDAIVVVVGCLTQVKSDMVRRIDGVDIVLGNIGKSKILDYVEQYRRQPRQIVDVPSIENVPFETMALRHFNRTRAFVKIQDGCNNFCSYCIIPYTRGNVRSKQPLDVLREIDTLVADGHQEIVLTGIHTGHYGTELDDYHFSDLLRDILTKTDVKRLRISSIEMNEITDEVLHLMEKYPVLVDHMHIPLQSGSDAILKKMNRKYDKKEFIDKIDAIKKVRPEMSITTDVIVGFPGETEVEFEETIETIKRIGFTKIHVFPYSRREGTPADLMEQVDDKIKKERVHRLMAISKELEQAYMHRFLNREVEWIPEMLKGDTLIGHTGNYLLIKAKGDASLLHQSIKSTITEVTDTCCLARIDTEEYSRRLC